MRHPLALFSPHSWFNVSSAAATAALSPSPPRVQTSMAPVSFRRSNIRKAESRQFTLLRLQRVTAGKATEGRGDSSDVVTTGNCMSSSASDASVLAVRAKPARNRANLRSNSQV